MQTPQRWLAFGFTQLLLSALWAVPLWRAVRFFMAMRVIIGQEDYPSLGDVQNYGWSQRILFCYFASFLIGTALAWFMARLKLPILLLPLSFIGLAALSVMARKPEEVIVMFPSPAPYLALLLSLFAGAVGGAIISARKYRDVHGQRR